MQTNPLSQKADQWLPEDSVCVCLRQRTQGNLSVMEMFTILTGSFTDICMSKLTESHNLNVWNLLHINYTFIKL